ncbi:hypothetical protein RN001_003513 [Aquatica leii]|uniref:Uncharacterized protein n=1 Tax=Aquatica leii TaxID=1421715 RepID=A0AAN7Q9M0_9COLE|nr:hypothetical protein RN001_003513 [Aquatica leii]
MQQTGSTEVTVLQEEETLKRECSSPPQPGLSRTQLGDVVESNEENTWETASPAIRKARFNLMGELTSPSYMSRIRQKKENQNQAFKPKRQKKNEPFKNKLTKSTKRVLQKKPRHDSTSSESDEYVILDDSSSGEENFDDIEYQRVGCLEDYCLTKSKDNWLQCIFCSRWLHEGCTTYTNTCQPCGAAPTMKKGKKKSN